MNQFEVKAGFHSAWNFNSNVRMGISNYSRGYFF